jgi:hypothetical protein
MVMHAHKKVAGLSFAPIPCPRCGGKLFIIPCKCPFRRKGWAICAKCLNPACAHQIGLVKRSRKDRTGMGGLHALSQQQFVAAVKEPQEPNPPAVLNPETIPAIKTGEEQA